MQSKTNYTAAKSCGPCLQTGLLANTHDKCIFKEHTHPYNWHATQANYPVVEQFRLGCKQAVTELTSELDDRAGEGDLLGLSGQSLEASRSRAAHSTWRDRRGSAARCWNRGSWWNADNHLALGQGHHRRVHARRLVEQILVGEKRWKWNNAIKRWLQCSAPNEDTRNAKLTFLVTSAHQRSGEKKCFKDGRSLLILFTRKNNATNINI